VPSPVIAWIRNPTAATVWASISVRVSLRTGAEPWLGGVLRALAASLAI
jgi:hypothetical protein